MSGTGVRRMRAAVLVAPQRFEVTSKPVPEPAPGEVRIRVEGCGVCSSSLPLWEGRDWFDYPREPGAPGHEAWGVVDAVGAGTDAAPEPGTRVAALSYHGFAEYDLAPADAVVPVPARLAERPVPGEPLGCAVNVFERSDVRTGHSVVVVGVGFLGGLLVQLAAKAGATVVAVSRRETALRAALELGAAHAVRFDSPVSTTARVRELVGEEGCDRAIEATGLQGPLDLAAALVRVRGRLVIAGFHQDGPRCVDMQSWNWRGIDVINAHERDPARYASGMRRAVEAAAEGRLDPSPLYSDELPLERVAEAFERLATRPEGFTKALVRP